MVDTLIKKHSRPGEFMLTRPYIPLHIQIFFKQNLSIKTYYSTLIKSKSDLPGRCETRWNVRLGRALSKENWSLIYKICFVVTTDNSTMWFQYKLIYNILATRSYLFNPKKLRIQIHMAYVVTVWKQFSICSHNAVLFKDYGLVSLNE